METIILSVGGSLIVPEKVDVEFLQRLKEALLKQKNKKFVVVCGGGATARAYQQAGASLGAGAEERDWVGIYGTRLNAALVNAVFGSAAHKNIVTSPLSLPVFKEKIIVAGGWKPGWSTDYVAVRIAQRLGVRTVTNLSNTDGVYDKDPKLYGDAKPLQRLTWKEFFAVIPQKFEPGLHAPFDPVASRLAAKLGLAVACINGARLEELEAYLLGKRFMGTVIGKKE